MEVNSHWSLLPSLNGYGATEEPSEAHELLAGTHHPADEGMDAGDYNVWPHVNIAMEDSRKLLEAAENVSSPGLSFHFPTFCSNQHSFLFFHLERQSLCHESALLVIRAGIKITG